jgi:hypothetical protein
MDCRAPCASCATSPRRGTKCFGRIGSNLKEQPQ